MLPVITDLVAAGVPVSIDTTRAAVAAAALEAGAALVNDVSGGLADPAHGRGRRAPPGCRGCSCTGAAAAADAHARRTRTCSARCAPSWWRGWTPRCWRAWTPALLVLDPGLGFAKNAGHNWTLLRRLDVLLALGFPVLVGASRKRFLGQLLADADGALRPPGGPRDRHRRDHRRWPPTAGRGACGCTTWPSSMDAVAVAAAWHLGASRPAPRGTARRERPDRAARAAGARPPRRVRARAPRRAGLRRRRHGVDGPRPGRRVRRPRRHPALRRARPAHGRDRGGPAERT